MPPHSPVALLTAAVSLGIAFSPSYSPAHAAPYAQPPAPTPPHAQPPHAPVAPATGSFARALEGNWSGAINLPGVKLNVQVKLKRSGDDWSGTISIPQQGAADLPLTNLAPSEPDVSFTIGGVPGDPTFRAKLDAAAGKLAGQFTQGGSSFPFELTREDTRAADAKEALEGFEEQIEKIRADWGVPGMAVVIVHGDRVLLSRGFGHRDVENNLPVTPSTLFMIGSSTKAFTAFVLGTLVEEGKLDWDVPVRRVIPELRLADAAAAEMLTARDMVTHRTGLPRHEAVWYNNPSLTRAELLKRLHALEPSRPFRERWQYNNLMFVTAGHLAERITGSTWEDLVRARIFGPLGMERSVFDIDRMQQDPDHALGYRAQDEDNALPEGAAPSPAVVMPYRDIRNMGPAGSIISSADDMASWLTVNLSGGSFNGNSVIGEATLRELHTPWAVIGDNPQTPEIAGFSYALGWFVDQYRGRRRVHHGGNIDGFSADVVLVPSERLGIAVLTNLNGTPVPGLVARLAIDRVTGAEPRDLSAEALDAMRAASQLAEQAAAAKQTARKPDTRPAHPLSAYAGVYTHPGYGPITISAESDHLAAEYHGMPIELEHWHFDTFSAKDAPGQILLRGLKILFRTGFDGSIEGLEVPIEPTIKAAYFTRAPEPGLSDPAFLARLAGEYRVAGQSVTVSLRGKTLAVAIPGQPTFSLAPRTANTFEIEMLPGFRVSFEVPAEGPAASMTFHQPNGVFVAERAK